MTATVEAGAKKRPSTLLVVGLLALLAALAAGGAGVLVRYQPLRPGSSGQSPQGSKEVASTDSSDARSTYLVQYEDGRTTSYGFSIRNDGRWGITVVGFGGSEQAGGLLDHFVYRFSDTGFTVDQGAFKAFALGPGRERSIMVTARFANCESYIALAGVIYDHVTVRYKTLGMARTTEVPLGIKVEVVSPANANCPRPRAA